MSKEINENTFTHLPSYTAFHDNPLKHCIAYNKYYEGRATFEYEFTFKSGANALIEAKDLGNVLGILSTWIFEDFVEEVNKFYALKKTYRELIPELVEVKEEIDADDLESLALTARECERARCEARKLFARLNKTYGSDAVDAACHVYESIVRIDKNELICAYDALGWC